MPFLGICFKIHDFLNVPKHAQYFNDLCAFLQAYQYTNLTISLVRYLPSFEDIDLPNSWYDERLVSPF